MSCQADHLAKTDTNKILGKTDLPLERDLAFSLVHWLKLEPTVVRDLTFQRALTHLDKEVHFLLVARLRETFNFMKGCI